MLILDSFWIDFVIDLVKLYNSGIFTNIPYSLPIHPREARELCSGAIGHSSGICAATVAAAGAVTAVGVACRVVAAGVANVVADPCQRPAASGQALGTVPAAASVSAAAASAFTVAAASFCRETAVKRNVFT